MYTSIQGFEDCKVCICIFLRNAFIQQGCIKLIKSDSKDILQIFIFFKYIYFHERIV